ncbi:hypothetical protein [Brevibacillus sp. NRS-1366]|uniref:hypothetical protein n=1 Tax=Brevibacillus sp. NRS-1366 TaxID=3233899 RepID=UPI003D1FEE01
MKETIRLREEIMRLQAELDKHQKALTELQQKCEHEFHETSLVRTCSKCSWTESLYY